MDSQLFAGPVIGIFCSGLNAYCMQTGPLFLRISGSSGVLKAFLLERNRQLSCNPKKKKKKGASYIGRGDGWAPPARGSLAGWSCDVTSPEGGVLIPCSFRLLSRRRLDLAMCCLPRCSLSVAMSVERSDIGHHTLGTL